MKKLLLPALLLALFAACSNDDDKPAEGDATVNQWIYETLSANYLWNDEVKAKTPDMSKNYLSFFKSLLTQDQYDGWWLNGKGEDQGYFYSYIEYIPNATSTRADEDGITETGFGFGYMMTPSRVYDPLVSTEYVYFKWHLTVAYVIEGSPAEKIGLKRGDRIGRINNVEIPNSGYSYLLEKLRPVSDGSTLANVTVGLYEFTDFLYPDRDDGVPVISRRALSDSKTLEAATVSTDPIFMDEVYDLGGGKKAGYLVYNAFERGGREAQFDDKLKQVFHRFRNQGVTDLVLDLRYNPGGYVTSCILLASMIGSASDAGSVFQKAVFNASERNYPFLSAAQMGNPENGVGSGQGINYGFDKIYVLAGTQSASASEALMHCLRGAGKTVYHIGSETEGKNVGMTLYDTEDQPDRFKDELWGDRYKMWPVTFFVCDRNGNSFSSVANREGLRPLVAATPGCEYIEEYDYEILPLGDEKEPLLRAALTHIETGTFPNFASERNRTRSSSPVYQNGPGPANLLPKLGPRPHWGLRE